MRILAIGTSSSAGGCRAPISDIVSHVANYEVKRLSVDLVSGNLIGNPHNLRGQEWVIFCLSKRRNFLPISVFRGVDPSIFVDMRGLTGTFPKLRPVGGLSDS